MTRRSASITWLEGSTRLDIFASAVAVLLPIAISPIVNSYTFTPKLAILLLVIAVGAPLLVKLLIARDRVAILGTIFVAVALAAALASDSISAGIFGMYAVGTGWLFWCATVSAWAIGHAASPVGRNLVLWGLIASAIINALITLLQQSLQLASPVLGLYQGSQADGLMGNPIFLESILVGGLAIVLARGQGGDWRWSAAAALFAGGLELSGERFAIPLIAALAAWGLLAYRNRPALAYAVVTLATYAGTYGLQRAFLRTRGTRSVASDPRLTVWKTILHAVVHRPVLGYGPGQTGMAVDLYQPLALAKRLAVGSTFNDAHDILLEVLVTTGLLGFASFLLFAAGVARVARGPLLGFAALALAVELIEPLNIGVTPLAFLALGAASIRAVPASVLTNTVTARLTVRLSVVVGCIVAAVLLAGDSELNTAVLNYDYPAAVQGADLIGVWAGADLIPAQVAENRATALSDHRHWLTLVQHWQQEAVDRQPENAAYLTGLALADSALDDNALAASTFERALRLDRYSVTALVGLAQVEATERRDRPALELLREALAIAPGYQPAVAELHELGRRHVR